MAATAGCDSPSIESADVLALLQCIGQLQDEDKQKLLKLVDQLDSDNTDVSCSTRTLHQLELVFEHFQNLSKADLYAQRLRQKLRQLLLGKTDVTVKHHCLRTTSAAVRAFGIDWLGNDAELCLIICRVTAVEYRLLADKEPTELGGSPDEAALLETCSTLLTDIMQIAESDDTQIDDDMALAISHSLRECCAFYADWLLMCDKDPNLQPHPAALVSALRLLSTFMDHGGDELLAGLVDVSRLRQVVQKLMDKQRAA